MTLLSRINKNPEKLGRQLARDAARIGVYPFLVLPSTDAAFRLLRACQRCGMRVDAGGNPGLAASWGINAETYLTTPLKLWSTIKSYEKLPWAIAIFEDQMVAVDESYLRVEVEGRTYMVSPIIMMILMKFSPPVYLGAMCATGRQSSSYIQLRPHLWEVPASLSQQTANEVMGKFLMPLIDSVDDQSIPWLARLSFLLKCGRNFDRILIQQIQEMETLVRLYSARQYKPTIPTAWLDILRTSRVEIAKKLEWRD